MHIESVRTTLISNTMHCMKARRGVARDGLSPCGMLNQDDLGTIKSSHFTNWIIHTHAESHINFTFNHFEMYDALHGCSFEVMTLKCEPSKNFTRYFCGTRAKWDTICYSNSPILGYKRFDTKHAVITPRFTVRYQMIENYFRTQIQTYTTIPHLQTGANFDISGVKSLTFPGQSSFPPSGFHYNVWIVTLARDILGFTTQQLNCAELTLLDGPSQLSPILKSVFAVFGAGLYKSSGFVVTINAFVKQQGCSISYASLPPDNRQNVTHVVGDTGKVYTVENRFSNTVLHLETHIYRNKSPVNAYINVTFLQLAAKGPSSDDCRYWGFVIYQGSRQYVMENSNVKLKLYLQTVEPLFMLCRLIINRHGRFVPIPNQFISNSNEVIMIAYSYHTPISHFKAKFRVMPTECAGFPAFCGSGEAVQGKIKNTAALNTGHLYGTVPLIPFLRQDDIDDVCTQKKGQVLDKISAPTGLQCIIKQKDKITNMILPYSDVSCVTLQHVPYYRYWKRSLKQCEVGVRFKSPDVGFEYTKAMSSIETPVCRAPTAVRVTRSRHEHYIIDPSCSDLQYQIKIIQYGGQRYETQYVSGTEIFPLETPYIMSEEHFSKHLQFVEYLSKVYGVSYKSYQLGGEDLLRHGSQLMDLKYYRQVLSYITIVTLTSDDTCRDTCIGMTIYYAVPHNQFRETKNPVLVYKNMYTYCTGEDDLTFAQFNLYGLRYIYLYIHMTESMATQRKDCKAKLSINPFYPLEGVMPSHHEYVRKPCCDESTDYFYVIWEYMVISWNEAQERCRRIGGTLPLVSTYEQFSLLENILLGSRFNTDRPPIFSPFRLYPFSGVFLGISLFEVRLSIYSYN